MPEVSSATPLGPSKKSLHGFSLRTDASSFKPPTDFSDSTEAPTPNLALLSPSVNASAAGDPHRLHSMHGMDVAARADAPSLGSGGSSRISSSPILSSNNNHNTQDLQIRRTADKTTSSTSPLPFLARRDSGKLDAGVDMTAVRATVAETHRMAQEAKMKLTLLVEEQRRAESQRLALKPYPV
jgi:hypothetical protein